MSAWQVFIPIRFREVMTTRDLIVETVQGLHPQAEVHPTALAGDDHWFLVVVSPEFEGKRSFQRQRPILSAFHPHFETGRIHALDLKCLTPEELDAQGMPSAFRPH